MGRRYPEPAARTAHHDCEFREVLDRVGDKWSLLVIAMLEREGPLHDERGALAAALTARRTPLARAVGTTPSDTIRQGSIDHLVLSVVPTVAAIVDEAEALIAAR